jgi:hypothetical protein
MKALAGLPRAIFCLLGGVNQQVEPGRSLRAGWQVVLYIDCLGFLPAWFPGRWRDPGKPPIGKLNPFKTGKEANHEQPNCSNQERTYRIYFLAAVSIKF